MKVPQFGPVNPTIIRDLLYIIYRYLLRNYFGWIEDGRKRVANMF
jgi:hypothetical protein